MEPPAALMHPIRMEAIHHGLGARLGVVGALAVSLLVAACDSATTGAATATAIASGTATATRAGPVTDLATARRAWAATQLTNYDLQVTRSCFCADAGDVQIQVRAGKSVSVVNTPAGAVTPTTAVPEGTPTSVEALFEIIAHEQATAEKATITYDPLGVPTKIDLNRILNAIDDEESFLVTLTPVQ